jgi:hypothetical protein
MSTGLALMRELGICYDWCQQRIKKMI